MMEQGNFKSSEKRIIRENMNGSYNYTIRIMKIQNLKCI